MPDAEELSKRAAYAAVLAAREEGCVCEVTTELIEIMPNVYAVRLEHDEWCPLIRAQDVN